MPAMLNSRHRLAIFMEGELTGINGKMGFGILRYSPNTVACVIDSQHHGKDAADLTGIARSTPVVSSLEQARSLGADVLVLGIAPPGGLIPDAWLKTIDDAVSLGFSVVNGLHDQLGPRYPTLAPGQFVWDIRIEPTGIGVNQGRARDLKGKRLLMIGTDMAVGKMTAGLEIHRAALERGANSAFVATGQIGITIMGSGVPLDAVRVDFAGGAIEREMLRYPDADLIVVEGQGSLVHPGSTSTLPLLRGSMATHLVLCHEVGREYLAKVPGFNIPSLKDLIRLYEDLSETIGTFPRAKCVGVCLDTRRVDDAGAIEACRRVSGETGLVCVDPIRHGPNEILNSMEIK